MKKLFVGSLMVLLVVAMASPAMAQVRSWDNLDWWAQSGAAPSPVRDAYRSGYWWWPEEPGTSGDDQDLWGNRGIVYGSFTPAPPPPPPVPKAAPAPPAPPKAEPAPVPERNVPVLNNVLFEFDKSVLSDAGRSEIAKVAGMLKEYPNDTITIEGHTCDINRSGDPQYNTKLGQRRADAVQAVLIDNGISSGRVSAKSLGEGSPAVPNTTEENRGLNRRVVFVYSISD